MGGNLAFWSFLSIMLRAFAIIAFGFILVIQVKDLHRVTALQNLKKLFIGLVFTLLVSNGPIVAIHVIRVLNHTTPSWLLSLATFVNAASMVVVATMFLLVYKFRKPDDTK